MVWINEHYPSPGFMLVKTRQEAGRDDRMKPTWSTFSVVKGCWRVAKFLILLSYEKSFKNDGDCR